MKGYRWVPLALAAAVFLVGCSRGGRLTPPPSAEADVTRQTTVTTLPVAPSVEGEWRTELSAAALLQLANDSPEVLVALGEDNVQKLQLAAGFLGKTQTAATLTLLLRFAADNTAVVVLPQEGMKRAAETVLKEYNPILAALLSSQIAGYLPDDVVLPVTYTQTDRTVKLTGGTGTVVLTLQGETLVAEQVTDSRMSDEQRRLAEEFLKNQFFSRDGRT